MGDSVPLFDVPLYYNHIPVLFEVSDALQFQRVGNLDHESAVSVGGVPKDQVDLRRDGRRTGISHVDHQGSTVRQDLGNPGLRRWARAQWVEWGISWFLHNASSIFAPQNPIHVLQCCPVSGAHGKDRQSQHQLDQGRGKDRPEQCHARQINTRALSRLLARHKTLSKILGSCPFCCQKVCLKSSVSSVDGYPFDGDLWYTVMKLETSQKPWNPQVRKAKIIKDQFFQISSEIFWSYSFFLPCVPWPKVGFYWGMVIK